MAAYDLAKSMKGRPVMINIRTIIGFGSAKQNQGAVHGAALGPDDIVNLKLLFGFDPAKKLFIDPKVYDYFQKSQTEGEQLEVQWNAMMSTYARDYPSEAAELSRRMAGELSHEWAASIPAKQQLPQDPIPTRKASGIVINAIVPGDPTFIAGSADLLETTNMSFKGQIEFQDVCPSSAHKC